MDKDSAIPTLQFREQAHATTTQAALQEGLMPSVRLAQIGDPARIVWLRGGSSRLDGALIVNKPAGWTSHDVVARVRRIAGERSIGHLGTLDPAATGVLPLLLGRLTRLAQFFQGRQKEYRGQIQFGFATDTYDATGEATTPSVDAQPSREQIEAVLPRFRGTIQQMPPPYSAKRVQGVRAYQLARQAKSVELKAAEVDIRTFDVTGLAGSILAFRVVCSSGTYIRSLAHDLGRELGVGAHLLTLKRTGVGEFSLEKSHTLEELAALAAEGRFASALLPAVELLPEFPPVTAPAEAAARLMQGRAANLPEFSGARMVRIFRPARGTESTPQLLGLGRRVAGSLFHPQIIFPENISVSG